ITESTMTIVRPFSFPWIVWIAAIPGLVGCGRHDSARIDPSRSERIERSLSAAASFLMGQQEPDGAWRPDTYGPFKDGPSFALFALQALLGTPVSERLESAIHRGTDYLVRMVQGDGTSNAGTGGLRYPVWTRANGVADLRQSVNAG